MKKEIKWSIAAVLLLCMGVVVYFLFLRPAPVSHTTFFLAEGLASQTECHIMDSGKEGPTIFLLAGTHGNEPAGFKGAEQLLERLQERGIRSTQATISRDIKELHLIKEPVGHGVYKYAVSGNRTRLNFAEKLRTIFRESITSIDSAQNIVVIKTMPGLASAACAALAPHARYYPCNETLRPLFYTGTLWHARDFAAAPVLLLPQGNYPLKNLHTVIKALPAVLAEYGDAELRIAGWPPLDKGPLLRPVIDRMFPYKLYCKRLAAQLGVTEHIRYTGPLDAAAMRQAYLEADAFLLPSGCENSPNSLGEAMLLGLPCVASAVGGIPSMLANGTEGLLYGDALDADALARAVLQVLHSPDGGTAMGRAARARALQTHDAAHNAADLLHIYESILQEEHP